MRIAILTLPLHRNFGGILQCYALQTVLERMGHEVSVLSTDVVSVTRRTRLQLFIKRWIKHYLLNRESKFYGGKTETEIVCQCVLPFIRQYIHRLDVKDYACLQEQDFDAIVVGSDQIWRPTYYQPIANAYLKFAKDWTHIKRVAYATSFGTDEWEYTPEETQECAALLKQFDAVSVRESSAVQLCKEHFQVKAVHLLDPTLLLTKEDYLSLEGVKNTPKHQGELFCYFLDETQEKLQWAKILCSKRGWQSFQANNPHADEDVHFEKRIQLPLEPWLAGFRDAQFVLTDSFHGCVFSILFNKPFIAIGNAGRGMARFRSLLALFQLEDCLLLSEQIETLADRPIQWERVNRILEEERGKAFSFLNVLR